MRIVHVNFSWIIPWIILTAQCGSRGGAQGARAPFILGKKTKKCQKEKRPAGQVNQDRAPLSSRSGSATAAVSSIIHGLPDPVCTVVPNRP